MTKTIITLPQSMNSLHQGPRYLWAVGAEAAQKSVGTLVEDDRYQVVAPQLWLDTQPDREPYIPPILPDTALPYLQLYPQRLHVPEVYGFCQNDAILLLENAPVEPSGELQTAIAQAWSQPAQCVRSTGCGKCCNFGLLY